MFWNSNWIFWWQPIMAEVIPIWDLHHQLWGKIILYTLTKKISLYDIHDISSECAQGLLNCHCGTISLFSLGTAVDIFPFSVVLLIGCLGRFCVLLWTVLSLFLAKILELIDFVLMFHNQSHWFLKLSNTGVKLYVVEILSYLALLPVLVTGNSAFKFVFSTLYRFWCRVLHTHLYIDSIRMNTTFFWSQHPFHDML